MFSCQASEFIEFCMVPPPRLERGTPRSTNRDHLSRFKPHSDYSRAFPKTAHQALGCRVRMRPASFVMPFGECSRVDRRGASRSRRSAAAKVQGRGEFMTDRQEQRRSGPIPVYINQGRSVVMCSSRHTEPTARKSEMLRRTLAWRQFRRRATACRPVSTV